MKKILSGIFAVMIALSAASISLASEDAPQGDQIKVELFNDRGIRVGEHEVQKSKLEAYTQEQKLKGITVRPATQHESTTGKAMEAGETTSK